MLNEGWLSQLYTQLLQLRKENVKKKKFRLVRDSNPSPRQYRCSDLPIKLTSQLGQLVELVSYKPVKGWWWSNEYIKIIYVNCGVKNYERWSSQLYTPLSQLRKDSLKKIDSGFEPLTSSSFHGLITNPFQRPVPSCLVSLIGRPLHRYRRGRGFESRTSLHFSGFLFATAKVAYITAMIVLHLILPSAVYIYDFHIFITSSKNVAKWKWYQLQSLISLCISWRRVDLLVVISLVARWSGMVARWLFHLSCTCGNGWRFAWLPMLLRFAQTFLMLGSFD